MTSEIDSAIAGIHEGTLLRRRDARGTLRSVYRVGDLIVKEFDTPKGVRCRRKPWITEDAALRRIDGGSCAVGVRERAAAGGGLEAFLVKRFIDGEAVDAFSAEDIPAMAALLAGLHAAGVVTDDANVGNFIRKPAGGFACIDFGRAIVFRRGPASFLAVGRELAKLYREGFGFDGGLMAAFLTDYFAAAKASRTRRALVMAVCRATLALRAIRKGRGR